MCAAVTMNTTVILFQKVLFAWGMAGELSVLRGIMTYFVAWYRTILHDPEVYPSPEEYKPERWLKDGQLNPEVPDPTIAFGYGRRLVETLPSIPILSDIHCSICPGRHLSNNSLYAMVSLILSVYNISPPVDNQGNHVDLKPEPTPGMIS